MVMFQSWLWWARAAAFSPVVFSKYFTASTSNWQTASRRCSSSSSLRSSSSGVSGEDRLPTCDSFPETRSLILTKVSTYSSRSSSATSEQVISHSTSLPEASWSTFLTLGSEKGKASAVLRTLCNRFPWIWRLEKPSRCSKLLFTIKVSPSRSTTARAIWAESRMRCMRRRSFRISAMWFLSSSTSSLARLCVARRSCERMRKRSSPGEYGLMR